MRKIENEPKIQSERDYTPLFLFLVLTPLFYLFALMDDVFVISRLFGITLFLLFTLVFMFLRLKKVYFYDDYCVVKNAMPLGLRKIQKFDMSQVSKLSFHPQFKNTSVVELFYSEADQKGKIKFKMNRWNFRKLTKFIKVKHAHIVVVEN